MVISIVFFLQDLPVYGTAFSPSLTQSLGMSKGTAITADSNGIVTFIKNPAAVTTIDRPQLQTTYTNQYEGTVHHTRITWGKPLNRYIGIAMSLPIQTIYNIPKTITNANTNRAQQVGAFNDYSTTPVIAVGARLGNLSLGTSLHYNIQSVDSETGQGFAFGIGARYTAHILSIGGSIQQLMGQRTWQSGRKEIHQPVYHLGTAINLPVGEFLADMNYHTTPYTDAQKFMFNMGYSATLHQMLDLQIGIKDVSKERYIGAGLNLRLSKTTTLHYTYAQHHVLGQHHIMGLTYAY